LNTTDSEMDKTTLNNKAVQNESTLNPETKLSHSKIITALMTNKKRPKVITVTGSVNKTNTGFTNMFSNPKTTETIIAALNPLTLTPFMK